MLVKYKEDNDENTEDKGHREAGTLGKNRPNANQQAAVHDISERSGGEAYEKNRQSRRRLHQRDQEGRRGEPRHEPHAPHILEPRPDICWRGGEPDRTESSDLQRRLFGWNHLLVGCHSGPP